MIYDSLKHMEAYQGVHPGIYKGLELLRDTDFSKLEDARVAGPWETAELAGEVLREQGLRSAPGTLLGEGSRRKNGLPGENDIPEEVCGRYDERLHSAGLLDFDDLLLEGLRRARGEKRQSRRFRHLLVDEFQDGNPIRYELALAWNRGGESLFVIGDPDQSIYSFRGADADCFARLGEAFPGLRQVRLVKNYRSTPEILACALPVIEKNPGADRALEPVRESGAAVRLLRTESPLSEGIFVAREIARLTHTGVSPSPALASFLAEKGTADAPDGCPLVALLRRPQLTYADLAPFDPDRPDLPADVAEQVEISVKYEGYIQRQQKQVEDFQKMERRRLPPDLDYSSIQGLRLEAREKLNAVRPADLGQASRISGVSPADVTALMIYLER